MVCPNNCNGHGRCVSLQRAAALPDAMPLSPATSYEGSESTNTWDQHKIFGCVCDSTWTVGLASGQWQKAEYFGGDCSLRRCPSGNDPVTAVDDEDCGSVVAEGGFGTGATHNKCHVDCSNRGICDYASGRCRCFKGFYGSACDKDATDSIAPETGGRGVH
jgi:hypothetical protein